MKPVLNPTALALLGLPAWLYGRLIFWRNRFYDRPGAARQAGLPVLSVGNLTLGGTGKTPIVGWLAGRLVEQGWKPAVVSRGYGGRAGRGPLVVSTGTGPLCDGSVCGDEPHMLASTLPGVAVYAGSDRHAGAAAARAAGADLVILDDGFQHRRLARDLDILLLDASNPFGNYRLIPAGVLREPIREIARAGIVLITRSSENENCGILERIIRQHNSHAPILRAGHRVVGFINQAGEPLSCPERVVAFCGIGNPERFRLDLEAAGVQLSAFHSLRDHHIYSPGELRRLMEQAQASEATLVTTEKDLSRIQGTTRAALPGIVALRIATEIFEPVPLLEALSGVLGRTVK